MIFMGFSGGDFSKEKVSFNIAKLKKSGETFEIVIDPDLAIKYAKGNKSIAIEDAVKSEKVFSDAKKGLLSSEHKIQEVFETEDFKVIADKILRTGEIQLSEEYRKQLINAKKKKIIDYIHTNAIDPKTRLPHPVVRIENAFEEAKIHIDSFKSAEEQIPEIISKLKPIIPISIATVKFVLKVPAQHTGKIYPVLKKYNSSFKEKWQNDGSLEVETEIPGGLKEEFLEQVEAKAKGDIEIKELRN